MPHVQFNHFNILKQSSNLKPIYVPMDLLRVRESLFSVCTANICKLYMGTYLQCTCVAFYCLTHGCVGPST